MEAHDVPISNLVWFGGWCIALLVLFGLGVRLPLQPPFRRFKSNLYTAGIPLLAVAVTVLANVALVTHDVHIDLTREHVFTPAKMALEVVDRLTQDVTLTYFYHGQDPHGKRLKELVETLGRRNAHLQVHTVDPDKQPSRASTAGVRLYNTAVLEAAGRRLVVQSTDETELAIGIQRVLRERVVTVCFMSGHNEYPMDNFEFHTHLEGLHDHSHDDAASKVVEMPGHGIGRLRRSLEALGFDARTITPATQLDIPTDCAVVLAANPRTTYLPGESVALEKYVAQGGALLLMYDLGFVLEPHLEHLLARLGIALSQTVVIDPQQHYGTDPEMVAVSGPEPHPITANVSLTFFPGVRALTLVPVPDTVRVQPLLYSSRESYTQPVAPVAMRQVIPEPTPGETTAPSAPQRQLIAVAIAGFWPELQPVPKPFRVVVIGDGDFASNSFLPYMANSDLALAMVRWLAREERTPAVTSRLPVPALILLTRPQMQQIFILTEILLPLGALLLAGVVWWKRR